MLDTQVPIQCDLFVAKSTIPNAGLGIFSTVLRRKGETITGTGDKAIPLIEIYFHNGPDFNFPMADYVWEGREMGMSEEVADDDVYAYWPGLDAMVNCHAALLNVKQSIPTYDPAGFHRRTHAGAGAISYYNHGTSKVMRDIPAGGELFKYYGDQWYVSNVV